MEDEENSRSSRDCRRYTEQIERLEQQLEDLRLDYALASSELHNLRRNRDSYHDEAREAEAGLHRQQGEVTQREGVITMLTGGTPQPALIVEEGRTRVTSHLGRPRLKAREHATYTGKSQRRVMLERPPHAGYDPLSSLH